MSAKLTFTIDRAAFRAALEPPTRLWLQRQLSEVASEVFARSPVSKPKPIHPKSKAIQIVPGRLKHSVDTEIDGQWPKMVGRVVANAPYAQFVNKGTKPHRILPRRPAYALAFWSENAGDFIVTGSVMHPGTRKNPYMLQALIAVVKD